MDLPDLQASGSKLNSTDQDAGSASNSAGDRAAGITYLPWHPLLAAVFPILSLYAHNFDETPPGVIWRPLGYSLLGTLFVWALAAIPFRQLRRSAVITTFVSLFFFSFGHIANVLTEDGRMWTWPICIVPLLVLTAILWKWRGSYLQATRILNFTALALIIPSILLIGGRLYDRWLAGGRTPLRSVDLISESRPSGGAGDLIPRFVAGTSQLSARKAASLPDIYYIILDAYGRADSLKQFYGYDNSPFIRALEARGFYIAQKSRANYPQTSYCLPSALNMNYLDALLPVGKNERVNTEGLRKLIDENAAAKYLRGKGYRYVYLWTGVECTRVDTADLELDNKELVPPSSFEGELLSMTALEGKEPEAIGSRGRDSLYDTPRAEILTAFHNLEYVPKLRYPKFVFAHILSPHPPFIFGPNGEAINPNFAYSDADGSGFFKNRGVTKQDYQRGYIGQLQYVNRRALEAIDAIKRESLRPPIIIIQGDHGSRMNVDWDSRAKTDLREPFSELNAYLVPDAVRQRLYPTITPVNSFRVLLNGLFGEKFPLLPDRSYFYTSDHPMLFTDVTNDIPPFDTEAPRPAAGR